MFMFMYSPAVINNDIQCYQFTENCKKKCFSSYIFQLFSLLNVIPRLMNYRNCVPCMQWLHCSTQLESESFFFHHWTLIKCTLLLDIDHLLLMFNSAVINNEVNVARIIFFGIIPSTLWIWTYWLMTYSLRILASDFVTSVKGLFTQCVNEIPI